jgi:hypothetical protein
VAYKASNPAPCPPTFTVSLCWPLVEPMAACCQQPCSASKSSPLVLMQLVPRLKVLLLVAAEGLLTRSRLPLLKLPTYLVTSPGGLQEQSGAAGGTPAALHEVLCPLHVRTAAVNCCMLCLLLGLGWRVGCNSSSSPSASRPGPELLLTACMCMASREARNHQNAIQQFLGAADRCRAKPAPAPVAPAVAQA